ncbi:DUF4387 domain-containing protein [Amycolatopsis sp. H20-H5]|uniref:DUF4387 domain-containing protein n=1 Tax=Amycolatopsis sp. H20-H5 TaxID=3046309 RepID=UPI002DBEF95B|nr:DUF4387 domain-containing protein [Amycolatopsis sp. H20-H5]MEC3974479.1 DUF4387 domain-containing protein [Amycolatopsis sp. H20-H5]
MIRSTEIGPEPTVRLRDLAAVIRSKNAGPYEITFDILFTDPAIYTHVRDAGVLDRHKLTELFGVPGNDVVFCDWFEPALAFKLTLRRWGDQGGVGERDTFGAQQHAPLLNLRVARPAEH